MARGVRWYLFGSFVVGSLGVLAGCSGGGFLAAHREPWRSEAEAACLNAGAVREGPGKVRITAISGPGACGADYPLKVSSLGDSAAPIAYSDEPRPPSNIPTASIPNGSMPQRWPGANAPA